MTSPIPNGPVFSVVTPFSKNGELDHRALESYLQLIVSRGARVVYAMAYNSRYPQLRHEEIRELNAFVARTVKGLSNSAVVIVGGPVSCSTREDLQFMRYARDAGADLYSALFNERYYAHEQVHNHYSTLARSNVLPVLVHQMNLINGRGGALMPWPKDLVDLVMSEPGVVAMKEDSKDYELSEYIVRSYGSEKAIILSGGGKRQFLHHYEHGARNWLNGVGVFFPDLPVAFWGALKADDRAFVSWVVDRIEKPFFEDFVARFGWHTAMRAGVEAAGFFARWERAPMWSLQESEYELIRDWVVSAQEALESRMMEYHATLP